MKTYKTIKLKKKSSAPTVILLTTITLFVALAWQSKDYKPTHNAPQVAPTSEVKPITLYRKGKALDPITPQGLEELAKFKKTLYKDNHMTPAQRKKAYNALFAKE